LISTRDPGASPETAEASDVSVWPIRADFCLFRFRKYSSTPPATKKMTANNNRIRNGIISLSIF